MSFWFPFLGTFGTLSTVLFGTLHMIAFVQIHDLKPNDVAVAQAVYLVWNTVNDLLGGVLVHQFYQRFGTRLPLVAGLSILYIIAALLPFFRISFYGLIPIGAYYFLTISLTDGCMSVLAIARGAMIEEVAEDESHQLCMSRWDQIFGVAEFGIKIAGFAIFDPENVFDIQVFAVGLAVLSVLCTIGASMIISSVICGDEEYASYAMIHNINHIEDGGNDLEDEWNDDCAQKGIDSESPRSCDRPLRFHRGDVMGRRCVLSFARMMRTFGDCPDFRAFVGASVLNEVHQTFNDQYRPIIVDIFLVAGKSEHRALANTVLLVLSDVWRFIIINVADYRAGIACVVRTGFALKCILPFAIIFLSYSVDDLMSTGKWVGFNALFAGLAVQAVVELTLAMGPGTFFQIFMARLAKPVKAMVLKSYRSQSIATDKTTTTKDTDDVKRKRRKANSPFSVLSLMWSYHALFSKPLSSIGPVIGAYVLAKDGLDPQETYKRALMLVTIVPCVIGLLQMYIFSHYSIKHTAAYADRFQRSGMTRSHSSGVFSTYHGRSFAATHEGL